MTVSRCFRWAQVGLCLTVACSSPTAETVQEIVQQPQQPPPPATPGPLTQVAVLSGNAQEDTVGRELTQAITVRAMDASSMAIKGQVLSFVVTKGGGSVFAGSAITGDGGTALERWTLGKVAGQEQELQARAVDQATGAPLVFATITATAVPGHPKTLALSRQQFSAFVGSKIGLRAMAVIRDTFSNVISEPPLTIVSRTLGVGDDGTIEPSAEALDWIVFESGDLKDSVRAAFLTDFRTHRWQAGLACSGANDFVSDSVKYGVLPGNALNTTFWMYLTATGGTKKAEWAIQTVGQLEYGTSTNVATISNGDPITYTGARWNCATGSATGAVTLTAIP